MRTSVLIAGCGPAGAALAARLGQLGVSCLVAERDLDVYPLPRAAHFDAEIMRVWQRLGIADAILPHTRTDAPYRFVTAKGETLMAFDSRGVETPSGWRPGHLFHQPSVERALRKVLAGMAGVDVRLGARFEALLENGEAGVRARIVHADGAAEEIEARFLVACDGASSPVRKALGIGQFDYGFDEPWLVIDAIAGAGEDHLAQEAIQYCDPARPTTYVPMSPGRYRWEFMLKPGETADGMLRDETIAGLLAPWTAKTALTFDRKAVYRFHGLIAERWRAGACLLAGDAAHQMPPFMGQGMCSGIRDAENLAWKLALVLAGQAGAALLDTYQAEREPQVRAITEAAIFMGRVVCTQDEAEAAKRDAAMLAPKEGQAGPPPLGVPPMSGGLFDASPLSGQQAAQTARGDDAWSEGFVCVARRRALAEARTVSWPVPVQLRDAEGDETCLRLRAQMEGAGAEAVLIRPDRLIQGSGAPGALAAGLSTGLRGSDPTGSDGRNERPGI